MAALLVLTCENRYHFEITKELACYLITLSNSVASIAWRVHRLQMRGAHTLLTPDGEDQDRAFGEAPRQFQT